MTADLSEGIGLTLDVVRATARWLKEVGDDADAEWFAASFVDSRKFLRQLVAETDGADDEEPPAAKISIEECRIPNREIAAQLLDRLMELARIVQRNVYNATQDSEVRRLAGMFLGNVYVDVIRPLHFQYPELVPEEMKK